MHSQRDSGTDVVGVAGHLNLGFFLAGLILMSPMFIALARFARSEVATKVALVTAAGTTLLGVTCITSLVHGADYGFFLVVAPLTNAAWLLGSVVLAVLLKRQSRVPTAVAIGLPVVWITSIPLGTLGGGVITGAYLLAVGYLLATGGLERYRGQVASAVQA